MCPRYIALMPGCAREEEVAWSSVYGNEDNGSFRDFKTLCFGFI